MAETERIILDHIIGLEVTRDTCFNEILSLQSLRHGLLQLAVHVWRLEKSIRDEEAKRGLKIFFFGNAPGTDKTQNLLLPCYFHWFGVSLCNYVRLVGFVNGLAMGRITRENLQDKKGFKRIKEECRAYVDDVAEIKDVIVWRNKVAAHFAITDPREEDNIATLDMSVIYPVAFSDGRFRVHAMTLSRTHADGMSYTSELPSWSMTEVCEKFASRYWPKFTYPA
ncbi:MAG: hypothetical protein ACRERE_41425 [Candidatus Entotheonellia bacterium]